MVISCLGEQAERFINLCTFHDIKLWNIRIEENVYIMNIEPDDFFRIKSLLKKTKVKVKILEKKGIIFWFRKQAKRKMFIITPFIGLFLLWLASHFLWSVKISGNLSVTNDLIENFLQQSGIYYGMPLSKIPIYDLKINLRNQYDEITWVSMKLDGTCLEISIKENQDIYTNDFVEEESCVHLVAQADGTIESILLRTGTVLKKEGEEVKKGDILIEGKVEIPGEDGSVKETRYCKADGDIWLLYEYPIKEKVSLEYYEKIYSGKQMNKFLLSGRNKEWGIDIRTIPYLKYDYIEESLPVPLLNFFSIPLEIKKITYRDYFLQKKKHTVEEGKKILFQKLDKIILSLEEKGVQIIEKNVKIKSNSVLVSLEGSLKIRELCNEFKNPEEIP